MNVLWIGLLVTTALVAWSVIMDLIPRARAGIYRSDLRELRDMVVDDVISKRISRSVDVDQLLADINMRIEFARVLSPFRLLPIKIALKKWPDLISPSRP